MNDLCRTALRIHLNQKDMDDYTRMQLMVALYEGQIDDEVKKYVLEAYDVDTGWDYRESDGCTGVSEVHSPKGTKYPPCVMHDYLRTMYVKTGKMSVSKCDWLFYKAGWQFGMPKWRSAVRALFVRFPAWWIWFRWRKRG